MRGRGVVVAGRWICATAAVKIARTVVESGVRVVVAGRCVRASQSA